jgi:hypothetical protein
MFEVAEVHTDLGKIVCIDGSTNILETSPNAPSPSLVSAINGKISSLRM